MLVLVLHIAAQLDITVSQSAPTLSTTGASQLWQRVGSVRNCPLDSLANADKRLRLMDVLPGAGFDNLRNIELGHVYHYNYSTCKVSTDGKYLLPDDVHLIPEHQTTFDFFAELYEHWDSFTSETSSSINADASAFSVISGKYSREYATVKLHQVNDKSRTVRVQLRQKLYTVKIEPDAVLDPHFKSRVFDIASNYQDNNSELARYQAELLIRDYGTHYISSVDAGGAIVKTDHVSNTFAQDIQEVSSERTITATASTSFFNLLNLFGISNPSSASYSNYYNESEESFSGYQTSITYSQVYTLGGMTFFVPLFPVKDWLESLPENLVVTDRSGLPIYFAVTPTAIPELPPITLKFVAEIIQDAVEEYYSINSYKGCTDPKSPNFNVQANIDDGNCDALSNNYTFGGMFQTCRVRDNDSPNLCTSGNKPYAQVNPLTSDYSCPAEYNAVLLLNGERVFISQKRKCTTRCESCGFLYLSTCCTTSCILEPVYRTIEYTTYWCAATSPVTPGSGYLFGGFYSVSVQNPFTKAKDCPQDYASLSVGTDIKVCVSNDYVNGLRHSVSFAGFHSCLSGNPLVSANTNISDSSTWPRTCPSGYEQHLLGINDGCPINFCVGIGAYKSRGLLPAQLPPFRKQPDPPKNATETVIVIGNTGAIYVRNDEGHWERMPANASLEALMSESAGSGSIMTSISCTAIVVAVTLASSISVD